MPEGTTMIRGSDGLDYKDLTARLLGEPLPTYRNNAIQGYRARRRPEDEVKVFIKEYDRAYEAHCPDRHVVIDWDATSQAERVVLTYRTERRLAQGTAFASVAGVARTF